MVDDLNKDEIVKSEILAKARMLFQQYGLKKTTMDEIAESCGKAKSTLYHYFKNKDEVFDEVILGEITSIRKVVEKEVDSKKELVSKMKAYFVTYFSEVYKRMNVYRVLRQEIKDHMDRYNRFLRIIDFERDYISSIIEDGMKAGQFSGLSRKEIPWFSEMIIIAFLGMIEHTVKTEQVPDFADFAKITDVIVPKVFS